MKLLKIVFILVLFSVSLQVFGQSAEEDPTEKKEEKPKEEKAKFDYKIGGVFGTVTKGGETFNRVGLRPELYYDKFGIALDVDILINNEGDVRKEDWDNGADYFDKIYFIKWGKKGDPFYVRFGGLDKTSLGYGIIVNGYTNTANYPAIKMLGLEMAFDAEFVGGELLINDMRDTFIDDFAGFMGGTRVYGKPMKRLTIGLSLAGDLNEYNGFKDDDGDGYADEIDAYPYDKKYATERDYYNSLQAGLGDDLANLGEISAQQASNIESIKDRTSATGFWATDVGYSIIKTKEMSLDVYGQFSQCINTSGWGFTVPGLRFRYGFFTVYAEYKQKSDDFFFGYYNSTYDTERATYVDDGSGQLTLTTKKDALEQAEAGKGYLAGIKFDLFSILIFDGSYQNIMGIGDVNDQSVKFDLTVNPKIIPKIVKVRAYYIQNNVNELQWKTASTVMGSSFEMKFQGSKVEVSYVVTYEDLNGDGDISGDDETIKTFTIETKTFF